MFRPTKAKRFKSTPTKRAPNPNAPTIPSSQIRKPGLRKRHGDSTSLITPQHFTKLQEQFTRIRGMFDLFV